MNRNFVVGLLGSLVGSVLVLIILGAAGIVDAALYKADRVNSAEIQSARSVSRANDVSVATPLTSTFTYQGQLKNGNSAVNGSCQMAFRLYDDPSAGILIGSPITPTVPVTNGLFTVGLNFGSNAFNGNGRWLDIQVNCTGTFVPLPRQALTPAPYALFATKAPWSGLTGVPAGFADGVDNTSGSSYQNVKIVAKSGGDFTTITAALNSIADASASNRYLVWVAPGVYTETVTMKPFVDIEGAGELTTRITFSGNASDTTGTLLGANNAELRFLAVENTGGTAWAVAIFNNGTAPRLTHVTASASGGTNNIGVYNYAASSPTMTNVTASASGGTTNYGVYNASSSPTMTDVTASASGGTSSNSGVYNNNSSPTMTNVTASASGGTNNYGVINDNSSPTMTDVTASASGETNNIGVYNASSSPTMTNVTARATGGTTNYGVKNYSSSPTMTNVTASALGGSFENIGVVNESSSPTINHSVISASGVTGTRYGIFNIAFSGGSYIVQVNNSQISGAGSTIRNDPTFTTYVGSSQLSGGTVTGGGMVYCIGVYDEWMSGLTYTSCP